MMLMLLLVLLLVLLLIVLLRLVTSLLQRRLVYKGFLAARQAMQRIRLLVSLSVDVNPDFGCYAGGKRQVLQSLERRFQPDLSRLELRTWCNEELIDIAHDAWSTWIYDRYQNCCLGISL